MIELFVPLLAIQLLPSDRDLLKFHVELQQVVGSVPLPGAQLELFNATAEGIKLAVIAMFPPYKMFDITAPHVDDLRIMHSIPAPFDQLEHVKHVFIDVGANELSQFFDELLKDENSFLVAFEPNSRAVNGFWHNVRTLDENRTVTYLANGLAPPQPLRKRIWLIAAAVGAAQETLEHVAWLKISGGRGECSSLLRVNPVAEAAAPAKIRDQCLGQLQSTQLVTVMKLEALLAQIPGELVRLKVDAQGADLSVVLSAGEQLRRVQEVQLEVQDVPSGDHALYLGAPTKKEVVARLALEGLTLVKCSWNNDGDEQRIIREQNCIFHRA